MVEIIGLVGGEPFYCPSNITYNSTEFYTACQVRAANFVAMWVFALLAVILMVTIPAGLFPHGDHEREMVKDKPIDVLGLWTNCDPVYHVK
ncbi:6620_t:CDS:2 [Scutellospora calospora]|uniref:6620_t:CDS:1 n=1 Tax=Scutellospora calospora TaxID=85575 RepID=A0ACA9K0W6_9GLOM|nr:6620_t:CDS:2 [Scutellospora calospora]